MNKKVISMKELQASLNEIVDYNEKLKTYVRNEYSIPNFAVKKCKYCQYCVMELDKSICYKDIREDKLYYIPDMNSKCLFGYLEPEFIEKRER